MVSVVEIIDLFGFSFGESPDAKICAHLVELSFICLKIEYQNRVAKIGL